jgi:hypothetical protein
LGDRAIVSRLLFTSCTILKNRQDACSTRKLTLCGTGILLVHKKLLENGATSQLLLTSCTLLNHHFRAGSPAQPLLPTRKLNFCEAGKPVLEHGAKCEFLQINIT